MKKSYWLYSLLLIGILGLSRCKRSDEVTYAGNASIQGKLQYTEAVSGQILDLPKGQSIDIFLNGSPSPYFSGTTNQAGYYSYNAPAVGNYHFTFKHLDTLLQFDSAIVRKVDLDTLRKNEYDTVGYIAAIDISLVKDQIANKPVNLLPTTTGIRMKATDANGNILPNVSLCVYSNQTFYNQNYPNCGGSLKYMVTNSTGIALLTGLTPNATYYINAQATIGNYNISNHYAPAAQVFVTTAKGTINPQTVILK